MNDTFFTKSGSSPPIRRGAPTKYVIPAGVNRDDFYRQTYNARKAEAKKLETVVAQPKPVSVYPADIKLEYFRKEVLVDSLDTTASRHILEGENVESFLSYKCGICQDMKGGRAKDTRHDNFTKAYEHFLTHSKTIGRTTDGVCVHKHKRSTCKDIECSGCVHKRVRYLCAECGGFPVLAQRMHVRAKERAKKQDVPFNITCQDILELIGDGVCPVLGTTYPLNSRKLCKESASLDKFVPELGYVRGNCAVISWLANAIKTDATAEQVRRVANWMDSVEAKGLKVAA